MPTILSNEKIKLQHLSPDNGLGNNYTLIADNTIAPYFRPLMPSRPRNPDNRYHTQQQYK